MPTSYCHDPDSPLGLWLDRDLPKYNAGAGVRRREQVHRAALSDPAIMGGLAIDGDHVLARQRGGRSRAGAGSGGYPMEKTPSSPAGRCVATPVGPSSPKEPPGPAPAGGASLGSGREPTLLCRHRTGASQDRASRGQHGTKPVPPRTREAHGGQSQHENSRNARVYKYRRRPLIGQGNDQRRYRHGHGNWLQ